MTPELGIVVGVERAQRSGEESDPVVHAEDDVIVPTGPPEEGNEFIRGQHRGEVAEGARWVGVRVAEQDVDDHCDQGEML